ncbi:MAG: DUF2339 domain-containing protein, partial [Treponema sp.]|nr:DUF2339 domain-containing protein [Treponema sp.]
MEGFFFLIIAAFLFAVIGVIVLLIKAYRQEEMLRKYGRRLTRLEEEFRSLKSGLPPGAEPEEASPAAFAAAETPAPAFPSPGSGPPSPEMPLPEPAEAPLLPPEAPFPAAETVAPETAAASTPETTAAFVPAAEAPPARKNPLAAFIRGGNLWAAGGIILLIAAFAMLITYLANRGFFTVEMGIAAAALTGLAMLASGWRFRKKRPVYFLLLQGGGVGILYLSIFAAHKLTLHFPAPV